MIPFTFIFILVLILTLSPFACCVVSSASPQKRTLKQKWVLTFHHSAPSLRSSCATYNHLLLPGSLIGLQTTIVNIDSGKFVLNSTMSSSFYFGYCSDATTETIILSRGRKEGTVAYDLSGIIPVVKWSLSSISNNRLSQPLTDNYYYSSTSVFGSGTVAISLHSSKPEIYKLPSVLGDMLCI